MIHLPNEDTKHCASRLSQQVLVVPELHFSMRKRCCVSFDVIASLAGPRRMRVAQVLVVRSCAFLDAQFCFPGMLWRRRGRAYAPTGNVRASFSGRSI